MCHPKILSLFVSDSLALTNSFLCKVVGGLPKNVSPCLMAMLLRLNSSNHFPQLLEGLGRKKTFGAWNRGLPEGERHRKGNWGILKTHFRFWPRNGPHLHCCQKNKPTSDRHWGMSEMALHVSIHPSTHSSI